MIIASLCYAAGSALITTAVILARRRPPALAPRPPLRWSYDGITWH